ncbi:hypothetical protein L6R50_23810 [Myxococcota bacterium]|nr:hypothetical protein [Myxococcota bacterium]
MVVHVSRRWLPGGGRGRAGAGLLPIAAALLALSGGCEDEEDGVAEEPVPEDDDVGDDDSPPELPPLGHLGINFWRFNVFDEDADRLMRQRRSHGTAAELLRDARLLGASMIRQIEDTDAYLTEMWRSDAEFFGIDSPDNRWREGEGDGWSCRPALVEDPQSGGDLPLDPWTGNGCGTVASDATRAACDFAEHAPPLFTGALDGVARAGAGRIAPMPVLLSRGNRPFAGDETSTDPRYVWEFHDAAADPPGPVEGIFWLGSVDEWAAGGRASEDAVLAEMIAQLLATSDQFGEGRAMPWIELGNELAREDEEFNREVAWLVLRLSELLEGCGQAEGIPPLRRVLPSISSPHNLHPETRGPVEGYYLERVDAALDMISFHVVRAALVGQERTSPPDPTRFSAVLGPGIEDGWADLRPSVDVQDPLSLEYGTHAGPVREWARARGLTSPVQAVPFSWFNSSGFPGGFLYVDKVGPLVETIRERLEAWWSDGDAVEIWCTETGLPAELVPQSIYIKRLETDEGTCYGHLGNLPWNSPDSPLEVQGQCAGADVEDFAYRMDPVEAARLWGGLEGSGEDATIACGAMWDAEALASGPPEDPDHPPWSGAGWPPWVFSSPHEHGVQVWTRLSFMSGAGVDRVFWHTNEGNEIDASGEPERFATYGVTEDSTVQSVWDGTTCTLEEVSKPYASRVKKPGYCALARWAEYLAHYEAAAIVPRFDGADHEGGGENRGFYAVAFRRSERDRAAAEYPYAVVAWADPQADPPWTALSGSLDRRPRAVRHLAFVPAEDPAAGGVPEVTAVETVPSARELPADGHRLADPCLDADEPLERVVDRREPAYDGGLLWRFSADVPLGWLPPIALPGAAASAGMEVATGEDPVLYLLPEGRLSWVVDPETGEVVELLDLAAL